MTAWPRQRPRSLHEFLVQFGAPDLPQWLALLGRFETAARNVLYVGAGTGRRAIALAMEGWHVHVVERDEAPVALFRDRLAHDPRVEAARARVDIEVAPIEQAHCDGVFDVVMAPDEVLNLTHGYDHQRALLAACAKRVRPGGAVVVESLNPAPFLACLVAGRPGPVGDNGPAPFEVGYEPAWLGADLYVVGVDAGRQIFDLAAKYHVNYADGDVREFVDHERLQWLSPHELALLAADAGLEIEGDPCRAISAPMWRVVMRAGGG